MIAQTPAPRSSPLREWMPEILQQGNFLGGEYWQWLLLPVLVLLGLIAELVVRLVAGPLIRRLFERIHGNADATTLRRFVRALGLVAAGLVWLALLPIVRFEGHTHMVLLAGGRAFTVLSATWLGWGFADLLGSYLEHCAAGTNTKLDDILIPLVRKSLRVLVLALGLVYTANSLTIEVLPLITGLGIGGLAFAFAAKDTIENLFGSIAVILDQPFEVGDWVVIGDIEGTVEELGFRSTRIRTFYNSQVTVPNATLVRATVDNYGRRAYRRWRTTLGVEYSTSPEQLLAFTEGIRELVRSHPYTRKDYFQVWVNGFGPSSIDVLLYIFHKVPDWSTELRERERMILDIVRLADQLGVGFAFPTQTLHLHQAEAPPEDSLYDIPAQNVDRRARLTGLRKAREITSEQRWRHTPPGPVRFDRDADDPMDEQDSREWTQDTQAPEPVAPAEESEPSEAPEDPPQPQT